MGRKTAVCGDTDLRAQHPQNGGTAIQPWQEAPDGWQNHPELRLADVVAAVLRLNRRGCREQLPVYGSDLISIASSSPSCLPAATARVLHKIRAQGSLRRDPQGATGPPCGIRGSVSRRRRAREPVRPVRRAVMSRRAVPPGGTPHRVVARQGPRAGGADTLPCIAFHLCQTGIGGRSPWTRIAFRARPTRRKVP